MPRSDTTTPDTAGRRGIVLTKEQRKSLDTDGNVTVALDVNPQPNDSGMVMLHNYDRSHRNHAMQGDGERFYECPVGMAGDVLHVKEFWRDRDQTSDNTDSLTIAINPGHYSVWLCSACTKADGSDAFNMNGWGRWRAAEEMPRWAARMFATVTAIRVEKNEAGIWQWVADLTRCGNPQTKPE